MERTRKRLEPSTVPRVRKRLPTSTRKRLPKLPRKRLPRDPTYVKKTYLSELWSGKRTDEDWLKELKRIARSPKRRASYEAEWPQPGIKYDIELQEMIVADKAHLIRRNWTKADWRRHEKAWQKSDRKYLDKTRKSIRERDEEIFAKVAAHREEKQARIARRIARDEKKDARKLRKMSKVENDSRVMAALLNNKDTTGSLSKATGLDTRSVRQSLRRLRKAGKANQSSPRRWVATDIPTTKPKRKRLADVMKQTPSKRKRLPTTKMTRRKRLPT